MPVAAIFGGHSEYLVGPTVHIKNYMYTYFYLQYLVLFTMVPRNIYIYIVLVLLASRVYTGTII